jgi:UDP-N-acetyl-D-mannosaminuronic acid transferase (WecB/TagA/CpsF family)
VLGVYLHPMPLARALARGLAGGLTLAPSGPGLCTLGRDPDYRDALLSADMNLTDSSFLILARLLRGHSPVRRTSGLRYLQGLLKAPELRSSATTFWVMPSNDSKLRSLRFLRNQGIPVAESNMYVAPMYPKAGPVEDAALLAILEGAQASQVFICVGGGIQEKLGSYLKRNLSYTPGIHCLGAAIAFLTGEQARIPAWADRMGLGWLLRCVKDPKVFLPRYARALELLYLVVRYDERAPNRERQR